jgi:FMN-dependent NADH-azoreductase
LLIASVRSWSYACGLSKLFAQMTMVIESTHQSNFYDGVIAYRDIGRNPIPHVDKPWIAAAFTSPEQHPPNCVTQFTSANRWQCSPNGFLH